MAIDITIPSPGESVTEVTLGTWQKRTGDWVNKDEPLVEIESDKVTLEVPAPESGLLKIVADSGAELKVGATIGSIDPSAKKPAGATQPVGGNGEQTATAPSSKAGPAKSDSAKPPRSPATGADHPSRSAAAVEQATEQAADAARATTMARKMAAEKGVDLAKVQGTGPAGRIRKSDVLAATTTSPSGRGQGEGRVAAPPKSPSPLVKSQEVVSLSGPGHRGVRREKMSKLRQRIAERLVAAQHNAAMLTTFNEADMTEIMRLRSQHKEDFEKRYGIGLGFMSFFVRACVSALQQFPRANSYIVGDEIEYHDFADVSVAVGTDKGLVVPIIRNAELMSFADIEITIKDLATRARDGKLALEEMTGGTFTITNGGVYGSLNSTPILNPPQSAILGMHAIKKRPIEFPPGSGQIALRPMMYLALSYDHRMVDGSEAVSFLVHVKNAIENPERMLLGL